MTPYINTYGNYENEYGQEYVSSNDRMYVHASVYLPGSEIDPRTGMLKPDSPRRGRTQAKRLEYDYLDKEYKKLDAALKAREENPGIRITLRSAAVLLTIFSLLCALFLLMQQGTLADRQKTLERMNKTIEEQASTNEGYAKQIAEASDAITICYAAARDLNMIPSEAAEAIHLVAMDTRPLQSQTSTPQTAQQNMAEEGQELQNNENSETQATMVPAVASGGSGS